MNMLAHGQSNVYWHGSILVIKPTGAFNMQGIQQVAAKVLDCIENRPAGDWVRLYVFDDKGTLGPKESVQLVVDQFKRSKSLGCVGVSSVGGNIINKESLVMICDRAQLPLAIGDSFEEGLAKAQGLLQEFGSTKQLK